MPKAQDNGRNLIFLSNVWAVVDLCFRQMRRWMLKYFSSEREYFR